MKIASIFLPGWQLWPLLGIITVSAGIVPGHAQLTDELPSLLESPQQSEDSSEELPAPQNSNGLDEPASILELGGEAEEKSDREAHSDPVIQAEQPDDSGEKIYLGLEAEELADGVPGLRIASVTRDSPAWKAGFQEGDRIIGINGHSISKMNDMIQRLGTARPGQTVNFLINRSGRTLELTAVLISASMAEQIFSQPWESGGDTAWLGLVLHDLSPSFRDQFGIAPFRGAAVSQVARDSPGQRAGIRAGDAVTEIDGNPVESASDVIRWLENARPGDQAAMVVYRGVTRIPMQVVLSSEPRPEPSPPSFRPPSQRPPVTRERSTRRAPPPPPEPAPPGSAIQSSANGDTDELLVPPPDDGSGSQKSAREIELESEVRQLRQELADAQARLAETREQLNNILRALRD